MCVSLKLLGHARILTHVRRVCFKGLELDALSFELMLHMLNDKRASLFSGRPQGCSLPVVDGSAIRYHSLDRKPITVKSTREPSNLRPWETSYGVDFKTYGNHPLRLHRYHGTPSHELAANPSSVKQAKLWSQDHSDFLKVDKPSKKRKEMGILGLETNSYVNMIKWQQPKEIVGTHPDELIPKCRDIRHIRKYRAQYLDPDLLCDDREQYKLHPPNILPPLTQSTINNVMVSHSPLFDINGKSKSACNFHK